MPWISWTFHNIPLWLPDQWTGIDDLLFEIADTIKGYNESLTLLGSRPAASREDYELKSVKWSAWRTLVWLWRIKLIVWRGRRSYLDPAPQIIDAVLTERSARLFSYDGDHVRHVAGDIWYDVEVIDADAFAVERSQGELPFPAERSAAMLMLPGRPAPIEPEPAASNGEPEEPLSEAEPPRRGPRSYKKAIIAAFKLLDDELVRNARSIASLFDAVLANIPDQVKAEAEAEAEGKRGLGPQSLRRYIKGPYTERRRELAAEQSIKLSN